MTFPEPRPSTKGWRPLMLALADRKPSELDSDVLIGLASLFFRLGADAIRREP